MRPFFLFACLLLSSPIVWGRNADENPCHDLDTQLEMNECACNRSQPADAKHIQVYKKVMGKVIKADEEQIRTAQRTWGKFRDQHCEFHKMFYHGGSIAPLVHCNCLQSTTTQRVKELEQILEFYEF